MKLALFDFDGTLTTKDSLPEFIKYAVGAPSYYLGLLLLSPVLILYLVKIISNDRAKERLISHFFKGWTAMRFKALADRFSETQIDRITKPKAMARMQWHKAQGHKVVLVSASLECWLEKWCSKNKIGLIATRLEMKDNKISGRFATKNCYGAEKEKRIKESLNLKDYDYIYAYGDSNGDREMLALADESFYQKYE
jgi:phosphatidylglycerophosphatase C